MKHSQSVAKPSSAVAAQHPIWLRFMPGLALIGAITWAALELTKITWLQVHGVSALTLAIALGILAGNSVYPAIAAVAADGVGFSKQTLLRAGIILYGLRLTFQDIATVGAPGVAIDALVVTSTFALSCWVGTRWFKLPRECAMLIGAGSSICGAAAIMAAEPVIGARPAQVATAVSTVVVFGTLAMLVYPLLYQLNAQHPWFAMSPRLYGIYAGSTIHEVAQVVAAGRAVSESAASTAVITKMVRVMLLAPFLIVLSAYLSRNSAEAGAATDSAGSRRLMIPWFAVGFVAVAGFNSLHVLPGAVVSSLLVVDNIILAMAMAALGVTTHVSAVRSAGLKPLALAAILFAWLILGGLAINAAVIKLLQA